MHRLCRTSDGVQSLNQIITQLKRSRLAYLTKLLVSGTECDDLYLTGNALFNRTVRQPPLADPTDQNHG